MADSNNSSKLLKQIIIRWYIQKSKSLKKNISSVSRKTIVKLPDWIKKRRRIAFVEAVLATLCRPRNRLLWSHPRSFVWIEMVEQTYDDNLWYANFRVSKNTFEYLLHMVQNDIHRSDTTMRSAVPPKRRLALTLYFLASTAEYRTIGNLFGVSASFVCLCVRVVCRAIIKRLAKFIEFPKKNQLREVIEGYEKTWGLPMCAGAIDGTHIPILAPSESHAEYVNRKGYHSIQMQAVVDCNYLYRDVVIGWPGSVHDARVFSNSAIFKKGNDGKLFPIELAKEINGKEIPPFIVADPAYPLLPWVLKGYPNDKNAPRRERIFNYRLSRARVTVENTFGRWKGRFIRFSKRVDMEVSSLVNVTYASCILHNVCELQKNEYLPFWNENEVVPEVVADEIDEDNLPHDANDIRETLANYFTS